MGKCVVTFVFESDDIPEPTSDTDYYVYGMLKSAKIVAGSWRRDISEGTSKFDYEIKLKGVKMKK